MGRLTSHHTKSRRNNTRSHHALKALNFGVCQKCRKPIVSHSACQNCGFYAGREVVNVLAKLTKRDKKEKAKELAKQEKEAKKETKELSMEELSRK